MAEALTVAEIVKRAGGGAVAADCATTAQRCGAASVELIYRRRQQDMPLTAYERDLLLAHGVLGPPPEGRVGPARAAVGSGVVK